VQEVKEIEKEQPKENSIKEEENVNEIEISKIETEEDCSVQTDDEECVESEY